MKTHSIPILLSLAAVAVLVQGVSVLSSAEPVVKPAVVLNPLIRYDQFAVHVNEVGTLREQRRLSEQDFLEAMKEPGVVLLDARSGPMFALRHLTGAVNLSLPDFNEEALQKIVPRKDTKILIYCNNNFLGSPVAMVSKRAPASLNIHTFVTLRAYGYTNVFELGPLLDVRSTKLPMSGREVEKTEPSGEKGEPVK